MASQDGYGTLVNGSRHGGNESTDQEQPLLGGPRSKPSWHNYMMANVHRDWADVVLLICYTITGLLDSASISTWGSFVSMQTGPFWSKLFPIQGGITAPTDRGLSRKFRVHWPWYSLTE